MSVLINRVLCHDKCKPDFEEMYDNIAEGIRIRSRYEEGEKSSKLFLNLGKFNGMQSQIRKIIINDQEITDLNKMLNEIRNFYESLFKNGNSKPPSKLNDFLDKSSGKWIGLAHFFIGKRKFKKIFTLRLFFLFLTY